MAPIFLAREEISRIATRVDAGEEPWLSDWRSIKSHASGCGGPNAYTGSDLNQFLSLFMGADGECALNTAFVYIFEGSTADAARSRAYLMQWAQTTLLYDPAAGPRAGLAHFDGCSVSEPGWWNCGLQLSLVLLKAAFAYELLAGTLTPGEQDTILDWFERGKEMVHEVYTAEHWNTTKDQYNNHLSFTNAYLAVGGYLLDKPSLVTFAIDDGCTGTMSKECNPRDWKEMLAGAVYSGADSAGEMWGDNEPVHAGEIWDRYRHFDGPGDPDKVPQRTGFEYSSYHFYALALLAEAAYRRGTDLFHLTLLNGESLLLAANYQAGILAANADGAEISNELERSVVDIQGSSSADQKVYYRDGRASRGSWLVLDETEPLRQIAFPPGYDASMLIGLASGNAGSTDVFAYYSNGTASRGTWVDLDSIEPPRAYLLAAGKHPADVIGFQGSSTLDVTAYYKDAKASQGTWVALASNVTAPSVTFPDCYDAHDVLAMASANTDKVIAYYRDGKASRGSWLDLGSLSAGHDYTISPLYDDGIPGNEFYAREKVYERQRNRLELPFSRYASPRTLAAAICATADREVENNFSNRMFRVFDHGASLGSVEWNWDFDGNLEGWAAGSNGHASLEGPSQGALQVVTSGNDPRLESYPTSFCANASCDTGCGGTLYYDKLLIELSATSTLANNMVQVFWDTGTGFNDANKVSASGALDGTWRTYELDLSSHSGWTGEIKKLRIDPTSSSGVTVLIARVLLAR